MLSVQTVVEAASAICTVAYVIGQIRTLAENNKVGLETLKKDLTDLITKNSEMTKDMMEMFRLQESALLSKEINHMKDLLNMTSSETRESIKRLEDAQRESNRIKSRLCMVEASLKSLHKRLDEEPSLPIGEDLE